MPCAQGVSPGASSIPRTDSEGRRVFSLNNAVSKCNRETNDFDHEYDATRAAVVRGLSSRSRKISKLIGGQVDDIRLFLDSLAKLDDVILRLLHSRYDSSISAATAMLGGRLYW